MELISVAIAIAAAGGVGYYIGARGMRGVKIDLDNTKLELEKVKNLVSKKTNPKTIEISTPSGDTKITSTTTARTTPSK